MNLDLNSYITELLLTPDPELVARRKAFAHKTKELEKQIDTENQCVKATLTLAEKISHRAKENELREALRQHKLNYLVFIQEKPELDCLPNLNECS